MQKRSSKDKRDINQTVFAVVQQSIGQEPPKPEKNPAAVALGRLGGLKGGKARAKMLHLKRKIDIARMAASAKWNAYYKKHPKSK